MSTKPAALRISAYQNPAVGDTIVQSVPTIALDTKSPTPFADAKGKSCAARLDRRQIGGDCALERLLQGIARAREGEHDNEGRNGRRGHDQDEIFMRTASA